MPIFIELTEYFRDCPVYINIMDISLIANPGAFVEEGGVVKLKSQVTVTVKEKPQEIFNKINDLMKEVLP